MRVPVHFYSYFKEMAGCDGTVLTATEGMTLAGFLKVIFQIFPKLTAMERSMLVAVGVGYRARDYILKDGDEVSLFPPVQGG